MISVHLNSSHSGGSNFNEDSGGKINFFYKCFVHHEEIFLSTWYDIFLISSKFLRDYKQKLVINILVSYNQSENNWDEKKKKKLNYEK